LAKADSGPHLSRSALFSGYCEWIGSICSASPCLPVALAFIVQWLFATSPQQHLLGKSASSKSRCSVEALARTAERAKHPARALSFRVLLASLAHSAIRQWFNDTQAGDYSKEKTANGRGELGLSFGLSLSLALAPLLLQLGQHLLFFLGHCLLAFGDGLLDSHLLLL